MGKKIRNAKKERLPYFIVIGDKEVESKTVTLESRDSEAPKTISVEELLATLASENNI